MAKANTEEVEFTFAVVPYVKQEPYNEFTPFVDEHLSKLDGDKSIVFTLPSEENALNVLRKIQDAARGTAISARKRSLVKNDAGAWELEIGAAPRKERAPKK